MIYLILVLASLGLFVAFLVLTLVEARTGARLLSGIRGKLDKRVARASFIIDHVNWGEFLSHIVQSVAARVAHDVAHISLIVVRFIERELTGVVRALRDRRPNLLAPTPSRPSVLTQTNDYLKRTLTVSRLRRKRAKKEPEQFDSNV